MPDSLEQGDLVMREDWIRKFLVFAWLELFGYLYVRLEVLRKYHFFHLMKNQPHRS